MNHETVRNNVQYGLTVLEAGDAEISVTLLLEDVRGKEGKQAGDFPTVILEVYDHQGKPITQSAHTHGQRRHASQQQRELGDCESDDLIRVVVVFSPVVFVVSCRRSRGQQLASACDNLQQIFVEVSATDGYAQSMRALHAIGVAAHRAVCLWFVSLCSAR